ncbi:MAG: TRAP transporter permease [Gammaproteobacteria bacterium]|nr:TRAP transporter permease [Gammaproteobacteria bacterium]MCB1849444.1 TRAP transporter permease [Gammaproteobacteria bacterium]MCP5418581.1 TRAP transporter permease [Chromatiaceae bacterium]
MTRKNELQVSGNNGTHDLVSTVDTGVRDPVGISGKVLIFTALAWSLFQIWYVSPIPFMLEFGVLNTTQARSVHLAFAVFLAFTSYPTLKSSPRNYVPVQDWLFGLVAAFSSAYLYLFYQELSQRPGAPITADVVVATCGILLLLEATRRALGPPLAIIAAILLCYTFFGPYMPSVIAHKGASLNQVADHQWLSTEGVYGVALGVSTDFVFLFVLFAALLERAGAGHYFIQVSFSLLGHLRGGPAKAAVVASGMTGLISGSSIANVVTTGTFTIPLMKRVGFPAEKAGAIEVASSTNGQLTPPIMGAAAFLMVEYVGVPYLEIIKHAFLPAIISYIALIYIVHLEAVKADMKGLPRATRSSFSQRLLTFVAVILGIILLSGAVYFGIGWTKTVFGDAATWLVGSAIFLIYIALLRFAAGYPELTPDDADVEEVRLPEPGPTIKSGLHFLLPVVVLVWCLTVERFSPGLSAFWATVFMVVIVVTQRPILAHFRGHGELGAAARLGFSDLFHGLVAGARNMVGIGVATAAAGIVVGTVTLTGIGLVMTDFIDLVSGGYLLLGLFFTALVCLILGMGLPTTANYIVVSALMAPALVALAEQNGLVVPLIAVHLFVFYFGILADDTPPVGLAAYAAAAISRGDPIRTGIQGFTYDIRTAVLPFMFIFNTQLLMIGVDHWWELVFTVASAVTAMLLFAAATQGFFLVRSRFWETGLLLLVAFTLFRPGFWMDRLFPPLALLQPSELTMVTERKPEEANIRLMMQGETLDGNEVSKTISLPLGPKAPASERLQFAGIELRESEGRILVDNVDWNSPAQKAGVDFDWEITAIEVALEQPEKYWIYLPALLVLGGVISLQRRRRLNLNGG